MGCGRFLTFMPSVFRTTKEGLWYDLPMDGRIEAGTLSAVAASLLGDDGSVRIHVISAGAGRNSVFVRESRGGPELTIHVTGEAGNILGGDGYVGVERTCPRVM